MPSAAPAVEFSIEDGLDAAWDEPLLRELVSWIVSQVLGPGRYALGLHLVSEASIEQLNREQRGIAAPTDVLSFPLAVPGQPHFALPPDEAAYLGDVVIAYPRVLAQAAEYGHSAARELGYLVAHGVLHILGFDHEEAADRARMRAREEEALARVGLSR